MKYIIERPGQSPDLNQMRYFSQLLKAKLKVESPANKLQLKKNSMGSSHCLEKMLLKIHPCLSNKNCFRSKVVNAIRCKTH